MNEFEFGTFIKKRRIELGMSQDELCAGFCAVSNLSRIENNKQKPTRSLARNLLGRLGLQGDQFLALWSSEELRTGALIRDIRANLIIFRKSLSEDREQIKQLIQEELVELEKMTDPEDRPTRQFLLSCQAAIGEPGKTYSPEEKLAKQLEAIRLTCPQFDPVDFRNGYFTIDETTLINQIANTYAEAGDRKRSIDIYRQLLWYVEKNFKELKLYPNHFCLISQNCAISLSLEKRYNDAIEIAENGRKMCIKYAEYQFLPGFIAIQAECYHFLGDAEKSRKLYFQAYYVYEAYEDKINMKNMRREMKEYLGIETLPQILFE